MHLRNVHRSYETNESDDQVLQPPSKVLKTSPELSFSLLISKLHWATSEYLPRAFSWEEQRHWGRAFVDRIFFPLTSEISILRKVRSGSYIPAWVAITNMFEILITSLVRYLICKFLKHFLESILYVNSLRMGVISGTWASSFFCFRDCVDILFAFAMWSRMKASNTLWRSSSVLRTASKNKQQK